MTSLTRGPLPASVYWRRRAFVLGLLMVAVLMVTGLVRGGGGPSGDDAATVTATDPSPSPEPTITPEVEPTTPAQRRAERRAQRDAERNARPQPQGPTEPVLAEPDGTCADDDVLVTPVVDGAVAGRDVTVALELRTRVAEACTWRVSPGKVTVRIRSGRDEIWTSRQCPRAVPVLGVVVRRDAAASVDLVWSGRRAQDGCREAQSPWALPGWYHVATAALGGEPDEVKFELTEPTPEIIEEPAPARRS